MGLDIRWPIGMMFSLIGLIMTVQGVFTRSNTAMYKVSLDININLIWGLILVAFGLFMLIGAKMGAKANKAETK